MEMLVHKDGFKFIKGHTLLLFDILELLVLEKSASQSAWLRGGIIPIKVATPHG